MNTNPVGTRLAMELGAARLSQQDLCDRVRAIFPHAPVAQSTISNIITSAHTPRARTEPRYWRTLRKCAVALGHEPTYFEPPRPAGETLGAQVYNRRLARNWSQEHVTALARTWLRAHSDPEASFHQSCLSRLESRPDFRPQPHRLEAICAVLDLPVPPAPRKKPPQTRRRKQDSHGIQ